jgi:hypothetical protein
MPLWVDAGADGTNPPDAPRPSTDVASVDVPIAPSACPADVPTSHFCAAEGCNLGPLALQNCVADGGTFSFYDNDFCTRELTLLVIAAGWSVPSMMQAPLIQQQITGNPVYAGRVRVVSVLFQDPDYSTPTQLFCRTWESRYGLTSYMTIDPTGTTQAYAPGLAFPATILIDGHGQIRFSEYGVDMPGLISAIDANLR